MTKNIKAKKPWPTKDFMAQIYENNLWGGERFEFYSGLGSNHPETVIQYIVVGSAFLKVFKTPLVVILNLWRYSRIITGLQLPHYHE